MKTLYIVTGATRGLGKAIIDELIQETQNTVVSISRSKNNPRVKTFEFDLTNLDQITALFHNIFSEIDKNSFEKFVLVNNAGTLPPIKFIHEVLFEELNRNIDINVKAVLLTSGAFIKELKDVSAEKLIVNISSGAAQKPSAGLSVYNSSKAAIEMFTQSVGLEQQYQEHPVKMIAFQPGKVETDMQVMIREASPKDFPGVNVFLESKEKGEVFTSQFVAKELTKLINTQDIQNGFIYKIRDLITKT